ncbi:MAG: hypothetical protein HY806_05650 [Nitrospirae bacterium]|nr:hypothetical protein [Nitrospirota bacterium]
MKKKLNCWEVMKCGREPRGKRVSKLGICPAATEIRANGINEGKNSGRACWAVAGTFCRGTVQGTFAQKLGDCGRCKFYKLVIKEEGPEYQTAEDILDKLERRDIEKYFIKPLLSGKKNK